MTDPASACFCHSGRLFSDCCNPFISGERIAETAEQLMRSRYSAYCLGDSAYLKRTWCDFNRPANISIDPHVHWIDLIVKNTEFGGKGDQEGVVEFVAKYKVNGCAYRLHEVSQFVKMNSVWFYADGVKESSR